MYTRTTAVDSAPGGDSVKQAILDLDTDLTGAFSNANTHEALTATHGATGAIVGTTNAQTLTNKTLTAPKINEDVALTAAATELNVLDGITASTAELNFTDGVTSAIQAQIDSKSASTHNHAGTYSPIAGPGGAQDFTVNKLTANAVIAAYINNQRGSVSATAATPITIFTIPNLSATGMGAWIIQAQAGNSGSTYQSVVLVKSDGITATLIGLSIGSALNITLSGLNVQATSAATTTLDYSALRI